MFYCGAVCAKQKIVTPETVRFFSFISFFPTIYFRFFCNSFWDTHKTHTLTETQTKASEACIVFCASTSSAIFTTFSFYCSCLQFKWHEWTSQAATCNERYAEHWRRCCATADKHSFFVPTICTKYINIRIVQLSPYETQVARLNDCMYNFTVLGLAVDFFAFLFFLQALCCRCFVLNSKL